VLDRHLRPLTVIAIVLCALEGFALLGIVEMLKFGLIVPEGLWMLALAIVAAIAFVASQMRRS